MSKKTKKNPVPIQPGFAEIIKKFDEEINSTPTETKEQILEKIEMPKLIIPYLEPKKFEVGKKVVISMFDDNNSWTTCCADILEINTLDAWKTHVYQVKIENSDKILNIPESWIIRELI